MAKRPAAGRTPFRLAPLAAAALLLAAAPAHADWRVTPTLMVSETWTDNIDLAPDEQAHSDLVTQVSPGIAVSSRSRRLTVDASAQFHQFAYLHNSSQGRTISGSNLRGESVSDTQRSYMGNLRGELAQDLLYVDAYASRGQHSISAFGPRTDGSDMFRNNNRTNVQTWSISPYLAHSFGSFANGVLRYTRDSVESDDPVGFVKTEGETVSAMLNSGVAFRTVGWGLSYSKQDLTGARYGDSSIENVNASLQYILSHRLTLTATAGYDRYEFEGLGGGDEGASWSGGFIWTPSLRTKLQASAGRHYYGNTGSLLAEHRSRHTTWNITYADTITTSRQQFLLPSTVDTAGLLDRMFATSYPDPIERARVVAAYIQATGLPPALADSINYLSNRFMRQKLLRASVAYRKGRSTAVLSAHASRRNGLSDQQSDSPLLGSQSGSVNDRVNQHGMEATYTYRINPRSNLVAAFDLDRSRSLTTDFKDYQRTVRVGLSRRYGERLMGSVELRRRSGDYGFGSSGRAYNERSLSGSLSMTF